MPEESLRMQWKYLSEVSQFVFFPYVLLKNEQTEGIGLFCLVPSAGLGYHSCCANEKWKVWGTDNVALASCNTKEAKLNAIDISIKRTVSGLHQARCVCHMSSHIQAAKLPRRRSFVANSGEIIIVAYITYYDLKWCTRIFAKQLTTWLSKTDEH